MERLDPGCYTLPEGMADSRDFVAEEAVNLYQGKLPSHYSLGERIYETNYQNGWGSCTSNATSHCVQVLAVKKAGETPRSSNLITPNWKDLWKKMGHDLSNYNDSGDYAENAIKTALQGIATEEGKVATFDGYAHVITAFNDKGIEEIKRYLYTGCPLVFVIAGSTVTRNEMRAKEIKSYITTENRTGSHAVALVGRDEAGFWFVNSWKKNNDKGTKSVFHISYEMYKKMVGMINWRYWILYNKSEARIDPRYLKKKNNALLILQALKKMYPEECPEVREAIVRLSQELRTVYPELNEELPLNT